MIHIVDSTLLNNDEYLAVTGNQKAVEGSKNRQYCIIKCFISVVRIVVAWLMELPQDLMKRTKVVH